MKGGQGAMKAKGRSALIIGLAVFLVCGFLPGTSFAQEVTVYGEAAWTDTDVVVYIYADTEVTIPSPLCSFGVMLTYPAGLTLDPAQTGTDTNTWYLGSESYTDVYPGTNSVVLIGGKLDTGDPSAGVSGTRVLLGIVRLTHSGATMPPSPPLGLTYGRTGGYKNFVCTNGTVLDDPPSPDPPTNDVLFEHPNFAGVQVKVAERCDANASGGFTPRDISTLKNLIRSNDYRVYADCKASGTLTPRDISSLKVKLRE
jgi:hypothetical protein